MPSSTFEMAATIKRMTATTKSRKIKDYAQIVQDAFAQIAAEAVEQKKSPDEIQKRAEEARKKLKSQGTASASTR